MISGVNSWIFRNKKLYELALGNALNIAMRMGIV